MKLTDLTFTVPDHRVSTVIDAMQGSYTEMKMKPHNGAENDGPISVSRLSRRAGGSIARRPHPLSNGQWALPHKDKLFSVMKPGENYHIADPALVALFPKTSPNFVGSVLSSLTRLGFVQRVARGWYVRSDT